MQYFMKEFKYYGFVILFFTLFYPLAASSIIGQNQDAVNDYIRLKMQEQQGPDCFTGLIEQLDQGMTASIENLTNRNNILLQEADNRFQAERNCRSELLETSLKFSEQRRRLEAENLRMNADMRKAQRDYDRAMLEINNRCRQQARQEQIPYQQQAFGDGAIADPTQLVGFSERVAQGEQLFFRNCFTADAVVKEVDLLVDEYLDRIANIEDTLANNNKAIQDALTDSKAVQAEIVRSCRDQRALNRYNEAVIAQSTAAGANLAKRKMALGLTGATRNCVAPAVQRLPASDSTRPTSTTRQSF